MKYTMAILLVLGCYAGAAPAQNTAPLHLVQTITMDPSVEGKFDHMAVDVKGERLFLTAPKHHSIEVFDLKSGRSLHSVTGLGKPAGIVYLPASNQVLFSDGEPGSCAILDASTYQVVGSVKLVADADSMGFDEAADVLYVVNGGKDGKLPNAYVTILDVDAGKSVGDIKIDSDDVEGVAFEKSGPRMFVNVRGKSAVEVYDRKTLTLLNTWSTAEAGKNPTSMSFDEDAHRLFLGTRVPAKLVVLDSDTGKIVASYPAAAMVDDMAYDSGSKRIYYAGTEFLDIFHQTDADHYDRVGHVATAFRAKTGVLVPELNRYYLAVPHHAKQTAELRVYEVLP